MAEFAVELLRRPPSENETFPFMRLNRPGGLWSRSDSYECAISLIESPYSSRQLHRHPDTHTPDKLIEGLDEVANIPQRDFLPNIRGILRVFVGDPAWEPVAKRFRDEHNEACGIKRLV